MPYAELFDEAWNAASNTLFNVALVTYLAAMVAYFFRMAFTRVSADGVQASTVWGRRVGVLATVLAAAGVAVHFASIGARWVAAERVPWSNMYEYSSALAALAVLIGLVVVQRRYRFAHLMGFVLALAVIIMAVGLMLYTDPGPLQPALQSWWIQVHVTGAMVASSIFIVAFAATGLYLVKDTAERRLAERSGAAYGGSTVGAARIGAPGEESETAGRPDDEVAIDAGAERAIEAPATAQRDVLSPVLFPVVPFVVTLAYVLAVWQAPVEALLAASVAALLGMSVWYAVPYLPSAAQLDNLAYRTVAFGFPIWTFAVIAGAIWAEEAWGRYWGWDPKETGSFVTWVLYAGYLHARATRGWRGRGAAWIGIVAFIALMVTFYVVNLFIVGLHSYAGV